MMEASNVVVDHAFADFSLQLYRYSGSSQDAVCVSPISLAVTLLMALYGAAGSTRLQMRRTMFRSSLTEEQTQSFTDDILRRLHAERPGVTMYTAHRIYGPETLRVLTAYQHTLDETFRSEVVPVEFSYSDLAAGVINDWVKTTTRGKITKVVSPQFFDSQTRLVLVSAIYFSAMWEQQFSPDKTREYVFHNGPNTKSIVRMMRQQGEFLYAETDDCQVLTMRFAASCFRMSIVLPKQRFDLSTFETHLTGKKLFRLLRSVNRTTVDVKLPKFKVYSDLYMNTLMKSVGMSLMFVEGVADFSKITSSNDLHVSAVVHGTDVQVDEYGSKATSATRVHKVAPEERPPTEAVHFTANHPFMFVITDHNHDVIYFVGRYTGSRDFYG